MMQHRRTKSGLFLMELIIAILFFSLSGTVCIQMFVKSHDISRNAVELNHALQWHQNVAETFISCEGDVAQTAKMLEQYHALYEDSTISLYYDDNWLPAETEDTYEYHLAATDTSESNFHSLDIQITSTSGALIYDNRVTFYQGIGRDFHE